MPLRVELKPFERIVIGETVLVNSGTRTSFLIDGDAPILRERDTITAADFNEARDRIVIGRREASNALLPMEKRAVAV